VSQRREKGTIIFAANFRSVVLLRAKFDPFLSSPSLRRVSNTFCPLPARMNSNSPVNEIGELLDDLWVIQPFVEDLASVDECTTL